jgi:hypothetical protein
MVGRLALLWINEKVKFLVQREFLQLIRNMIGRRAVGHVHLCCSGYHVSGGSVLALSSLTVHSR